MRGLTWRIVTVIFTVVFALYLLIPTIIKFKYGKQVSKVVKAEDPWYYNILPSEVLKLGLDLMGGLHLVLGVDLNEVDKDAAVKVRTDLKGFVERDKIAGVVVDTDLQNRILVHYPSDDAWKKVEGIISKNFNQQIDFESQSNQTAVLRLTQYWQTEVHKRAVDQSLETLRNRIDEFGIAEPIIQRQGEEKIMVQFPGVTETGRLKEIIARTAKLSFQLERSGPEEPSGLDGAPRFEQLDGWVKDFVKSKNIKLDVEKPITSYTKEVNQYLADKIPKGTDLIFHKRVNVNTNEAEYVPYLVDRESLVTGEDLQDAYYGFDSNTNGPIVNFQLTPGGATKFEQATGANIGKYMAIVLDNNVHSAPRIKSRIPGGRAMIEMASSGRPTNEVQNDAKDTALVLRSGALPARLEFLEERTVGPSLGGDAIRSGMISLTAGLTLVFLFMAVYYKASGLIADIALGLNGLFVVAALAAFEGTLTLPGLAGITLTLGMAVDANVLIFEHVREELRSGKSLAMSISEGYSRAFTAIFDTHVTTIVASIVLLSFGYGPIRGFAVTLLIGLAASLYTSVFVTRVIIDWLLTARNVKTLSV